MNDWEHVDKEEIIISEDGLDEAIHNAYLKGRNDVLDKIRAEIEDQTLGTNPYKNEGLYEAIHIIDKYRGEKA